MCENVIENLTSKNDKFSCAYADKIISESKETNKWYKYFDEFATLLEHPKSLVRNRALYILAANARWGGISEETQISICVDDGHKTAKNVVKTGAFTVSITDAENVVACDYVGFVSGNKESDKIAKAGWHITKNEFVDAPLFDELPMALECKLISYDEETCRLVGEIVNVYADEKILDQRRISLSSQTEKEHHSKLIYHSDV